MALVISTTSHNVILMHMRLNRAIRINTDASNATRA